MRVLVVEDDPTVRHVVDVMLTRRGYHTIVASSANEASAHLLDLQFTPDAALLDVVLIGMTGIEFGRLLMRVYPTIRLIFMTGWPDRDDIETRPAQSLLLRKPFTKEMLIEAVGPPHSN